MGALRQDIGLGQTSALQASAEAAALRVLIAAATRQDAEHLAKQLERGGFTPAWQHTATAGEFRAALGEPHFDLVVADYGFAGFSAFEALEILDQSGADIPLIVFSNEVGDEAAVTAVKSGAYDFVSKLNPKRLPVAAARALREAQNRREHKRAVEELRAAEAKYRALVEHLPAIVYVASPKPPNQTLYVSPQVETILGFTRQEWESSSSSWENQIFPDDRERVSQEWFSSLADGRTFRSEYRILTRDGRMLWFYDEGLLVKDESGRILSVQGFMLDITERRRAEEGLTRLAAILGSLDDAVISKTLDGIVMTCNPGGERMYGYAPGEMVGKPVSSLITHERIEEEAEILAKTEHGEVLKNFETIHLRKDGKPIDVSLTVSPLKDSQNRITGAAMISRDITAVKQLEKQLLQAQKMEAVGRLAGGVAHDFNNLLTAITGYTDLLLTQTCDGHPFHPDLVEISKAAERAASLTRQLLAFSRRQVLAAQVTDLNSIVLNMERMLRRIIGDDIELITELDPELGRVKVDPSQIEQVLMNLFVNARDAMPDGGKLVIESMNVELDQEYASAHVSARPGAYAMLVVSDTGIGMDPETRARVFEPFFTTKEQGKGTGLGLAMAYGIVKQSGGNIWVYSEPGRGSSFKIYLPRVNSVAPVASGGETRVQSLQGSETILIVEDEDVVRNLVQQVLNRAGYRLLVAHNALEALALTENHHEAIDLMITDLVMPQMSGKELAEEMSKRRPQTKILYMSGYSDAIAKHQGLLDPGMAFLQKPFRPDSLARKVREILDTRCAEA